MNQIHAIPAFNDNYIWAMATPDNKVLVVDPGDAVACLNFIKDHAWKLSSILITHHHHDHTNGIQDCLKAYPQAKIYGPQYSESKHLRDLYQHLLRHKDNIKLNGFCINTEIIHTPGHTLDHICYYSHNENILFCGDTLFAGGCGRIFEGTATQMYNSLCKLSALPRDCAVFCAHEYTQANLKFALEVEPENIKLKQRYQEVCRKRQAHEITLPSTIGTEQDTNPFLRCHLDSIHQAAKKHAKLPMQQNLTNTEVFAIIRSWKDRFK